MATRRHIEARRQASYALTALGQSAPCIAKQLGVSSRTVERDRAAVRAGLTLIDHGYIADLEMLQLGASYGNLHRYLREPPRGPWCHPFVAKSVGVSDFPPCPPLIPAHPPGMQWSAHCCINFLIRSNVPVCRKAAFPSSARKGWP